MPGNFLQRQSPFGEPPRRYGKVDVLHPEAAMEMTDRWRHRAAAVASSMRIRGTAYNKNIYKGDYPIRGNDTFLRFTGVSDTLAESRTVPTPSGVSAAEPGSIGFFGRDNQNLFAENVTLSFDIFQGLTAFQPVKQRIKATLIANLNRGRSPRRGSSSPTCARGRSGTTATWRCRSSSTSAS